MGRDKDNVYCLLNHNREKKSIVFDQENTYCRDLLIRDSLIENAGFKNRKYQNINKTSGREHSAACFIISKD